MSHVGSKAPKWPAQIRPASPACQLVTFKWKWWRWCHLCHWFKQRRWDMTHGDTHADIGNAVRKQNYAPGLCTACFAGVLYRENVYNVFISQHPKARRIPSMTCSFLQEHGQRGQETRRTSGTTEMPHPDPFTSCYHLPCLAPNYQNDKQMDPRAFL